MTAMLPFGWCRWSALQFKPTRAPTADSVIPPSLQQGGAAARFSTRCAHLPDGARPQEYPLSTLCSSMTATQRFGRS